MAGYTILLVEDNEMNRDMLSRRLAKHGFEVIVAEDGEKGLAMAAEKQPSLVLMDMSLPKIDGWTATSMLKEHERTRHIPVIALTAHAMEGDRERALAAGCDDYDVKPIQMERLLEKIRSHLPADRD